MYDAGVEHELLGRPLSRLVWGTDGQQVYASTRVVGRARPGSAVLDVPCGGGFAFRGLREGQDVRYVAADVSLGQLGRARRRGAKRHLSQIQLVEASMTELPFADGEFDLVLSLNGLNCMDAPEASLAELARCLRPGGWLIGSTIVRGAGRRFDWTIRHWQWRGGFGPVETAEDVSRWLESAGFPEAELQRSGAVAYFSARRPDPPHDQSRA